MTIHGDGLMGDGAEECMASADQELHDNAGNPDWEDEQDRQRNSRYRSSDTSVDSLKFMFDML